VCDIMDNYCVKVMDCHWTHLEVMDCYVAQPRMTVSPGTLGSERVSPGTLGSPEWECPLVHLGVTVSSSSPHSGRVSQNTRDWQTVTHLHLVEVCVCLSVCPSVHQITW